MSEISAEVVWKLIEKLEFYEYYKKNFSNVDVLKLLRENVTCDEIIIKIIKNAHKELTENES